MRLLFTKIQSNNQGVTLTDSKDRPLKMRVSLSNNNMKDSLTKWRVEVERGKALADALPENSLRTKICSRLKSQCTNRLVCTAQRTKSFGLQTPKLKRGETLTSPKNAKTSKDCSALLEPRDTTRLSLPKKLTMVVLEDLSLVALTSTQI
jgi:hypothetical protein